MPRLKMPSPARRLAFCLAGLLLSAHPAPALIIYGTGPTDVNNALNVLPPDTLPPNGSPAPNIARIGLFNASGVYLGNGYVLTANHVIVVDSGIVINGVSYNRDLTFTPLQITEDDPGTAYSDVVDLKLIKILGNPGLPPLPVVQSLPLNYSTATDFNAAATLMGWGFGKGAIVSNKGWQWGDNSTQLLRWGTNATLPGTYTASYSGYQYDVLHTEFRRSLGSNTAQITQGDSGGALFQQFGGVWKLSGTATTTLSYQGGAALFDGQYPIPPGDQPDAAEFVRISRYGHLMRAVNWASAKLGNAAAPLTADTDFDGIPHLLEYAFHTDPNVASVAALPQLGMEGGFLTLTYTQLLSATDLSYLVQESADLANPLGWGPATMIEEIVSTSGLTRIVKAKVAIGAATQKFLRLLVSTVP